MKSLETKNPKGETLLMRRIVVAVDLTDHSEATANYAARIAKSFNASLYVVHVFPAAPVQGFEHRRNFRLIEQERNDLGAQLNHLAGRLRKFVPTCEPVFLTGEPAEQISGLAREVEADLVVVGGHNPTFLGGLLNLGEPPKIMHRAPCPVLIHHGKKE